jgi:4-carboxymuconolactone decarboxylase
MNIDDRPTEPRISPLPAGERSAEQEELLAGVGAPGGGELNIFATLVRHPRLARRWMAFGGTLLRRSELSDRQRELLILRTGHRCRSPYEWAQHVRIALDAGISEEEIDRVVAGPSAPGWAPLEAALLRAADELHDDACISDGTWRELAASLDERQLIEVPMVVGQYHLVAFTLNSLGVQVEAEGEEGR